MFDIDGTILDSYDFVYEALKFSAKTHGVSIPEEAFRKVMGHPLLEFYKLLLPNEKDISRFVTTHKDFQKDKFHLIQPFPEVVNTLKTLKKKQFLLAAISNRTSQSLLYSLKLVGILEYFDVILGADDVKNPKPHKDHLLTALKKLGVKSKDAYMVGDTNEDIKAGKNAKVKTIAVTYGFLGPEIKECNPDFVIDEIEKLLKILSQLRRSRSKCVNI